MQMAKTEYVRESDSSRVCCLVYIFIICAKEDICDHGQYWNRCTRFTVLIHLGMRIPYLLFEKAQLS